MQKNQINCSKWGKLEQWNLVDSALLLSNIDPDWFRDKFKTNIEEHFKSGIEIQFLSGPVIGYNADTHREVKINYDFLNSINLALKYSNSPYLGSVNEQAYHPYLIVYEAFEGGLCIPEHLKTVIERRFVKETKKSIFNIDSSFLNGMYANKEEGKSKRERNLLKIIGIMANMLSELSCDYTNGKKVNSKVIRENIVIWAEDHGIDSYGLATADRAISEGIESINKVLEIS